MKILILGGTRFLGKAFVNEGLKRNHEITLFNRGNHKDVFPEVEQLIGDRDGDVSLLENRTWDAVIDTCGLTPHHIKKMAQVLGRYIDHYTYISSISVYKDWIPHGITEDYHLQSNLQDDTLKDIEEGKISPYEHYGALKVLCENEAEKHWPGQVLNVRAGQLVGPFDYTDRLPYWIQRIELGGKILVPGRPNRPIQLIDIEDIASWVFDMAENKNGGTFNVTGPNYELTMKELLDSCKKVTNSDAEIVWVEEEFLLENKVAPWTEMPLWIPENFPIPGEHEPWQGTFSINIEKAVNAGLSFRPLDNTIEDVYQWLKDRQDTELKAGLSQEREQSLLETYQKEKSVKFK